MARKKRKAAGASALRRGGRDLSLAPFPPSACAEPIWRHFWTLLAAGFALRLLAAFSADWTYRSDEIMQYLEQAHRFVFGAGFMAWEVRFGARNMLVIAPAAGILALCKGASAGPACYIPAVELFYAAFSLALPASLYFIVRRMHGEAAGRAALVLSCFWYTFVVFAPHLMPEQTAAILIFAGLACVPPSDAALSAKGGVRLFLAGFFIGLGGLLRLPYIPIAGLLGILILIKAPARRAPAALGGALAALLVAGGADWIVWGGFMHSTFAFMDLWALTDGFASMWSISEGAEWYAPMHRLAACSAGLWPLLFVLAATDWRRHWLSLGGMIVLLAVHAVTLTIAYSHVFLALPLCALMFGGISARPPEYLRGFLRDGKTFIAGALALLSFAGAAQSLPGQPAAFWTSVRHPHFFFYESPLLLAARFLSRVPPEKMRAVVWNAPDPIWTGGYYYLHHPVPQWHEGMKVHRPGLEGRPLGAFASHYVALSPDGARRALAAGFEEAANFGGAVVYENPEWEKIPTRWERPFPLSLGIANEENLERELKAAGRSMPPPEFLPHRE